MSQHDEQPIHHDLQSLALELQHAEHERAIRRGRDSIFGTNEAWQHNAGVDWHDVDDDSYLEFENCQQPNCLLVRTSSAAAQSRLSLLEQENATLKANHEDRALECYESKARLVEYGQHKPTCAIWWTHPKPCTCSFSALL